MRRAIVTGGADSLEQVQRYMPDNYTARVVIIIEGEDDHGWTLDDYVIPRLASGLIWAEELNS